MDSKRMRFAVGIAIIVGAVVYLVASSTASTKMYYLTVPELFARGDGAKDIPLRVSGRVVSGSIDRELNQSVLRFEIADPKHPNEVLHVVYRRATVPDTFKDGADAVVEGRYAKDDVFEARSLFAKCPSKYESMKPPTGGVSS